MRRDGPMHEDELFAALRQDFGYGSLNSRVRAVLTDGLLSAIKEAAASSSRGEYAGRPVWLAQ